MANSTSTRQPKKKDVPVERITHYIVRDYRRMSLERQTLIAYIRNLENIYKATQMDLYRNVAKGTLSRKRLKQEVTLILYNSTKEHMRAQQRLREALDRSNAAEHHDNL